jgi:hypothetical protein
MRFTNQRRYTDTETGLGIIIGGGGGEGGGGGGSKEEEDCRYISLAKSGQECELNIQIDLRRVDLLFFDVKKTDVTRERVSNDSKLWTVIPGHWLVRNMFRVIFN